MNNFTKMAEEWMRQHHRAPAVGAGRPKPALPEVDPSAWSEDLHRWLLEQCVYRDRCFNGIWALHRDFCEWVIAHDGAHVIARYSNNCCTAAASSLPMAWSMA
jgi:hypothetical protein